MAQNIEFKKVTSNFQARLSDDARNIKKNPKLLISADKTKNLYELTADEINKLLTENISKTYKKSNLSRAYFRIQGKRLTSLKRASYLGNTS